MKRLFRKRHHKAVELKAQEIKAELAKPHDYQTEWMRKRSDISLPPEERFGGEMWFEKQRDGIFRFPVGR